jgi:hypothetical protein
MKKGNVIQKDEYSGVIEYEHFEGLSRKLQKAAFWAIDLDNFDSIHVGDQVEFDIGWDPMHGNFVSKVETARPAIAPAGAGTCPLCDYAYCLHGE